MTGIQDQADVAQLVEQPIRNALCRDPTYRIQSLTMLLDVPSRSEMVPESR